MKLSIIVYYLKTLMIMAAGPLVLSAQSPGEPSLLPLPKVIKWSGDKFRFQHENLFSDPRVRKVTLPFLENVPLNMDEAYRLAVNDDSILIYATGDEGFFRADSTIKQLRMTDHAGQYLAGCQITDWPAFRIRGFMHDCGRSFIPLEELKREINILSGFKINTFHWHLTEDIAWRLASDIIPQLTSAEVARRDKNNYYSKEEVADFVRYCNDHFIEVIPEIDMPGHGRFKTVTRDWYWQIQERIEEVASVSKATLIDFYATLKDRPDLLTDNLHPDEEGAVKLAKTVWSAITGNYNGLQLPEAWSDNMVLQRGQTIRLRGNSNKNDSVKVSIAGKSFFAKASSTGKWEVMLDPLKSGGPYELIVTTPNDTIIVRNILAGEVWFCSGQSNMEWPLNRSNGWNEIQNSISDPYFRIINYRRKPLSWDQPWDSLTLSEINNLDFFEDATWSEVSTESARDFSAVAYYFGRKLREEMGVPVGLIAMAVGGSPAEAWIERKAIESHPRLSGLLYDYRKAEFQEKWVSDVISKNLEKTNNQKQRHPFEPAYLYESGISKIAGFPIKGFIWYQGESNASFPELYEVMLPVMVQSWRVSWKDTTLPFYFAQLSSLNRPSWPEFRDTQRKLAEIIPHSGMIVTTDAGHPTDVHPRDKRTVGERFASLALRKSYGKKWYSVSPEIYKATYNGRKIIISFKNTSKLLTSDGLPVREIEISGTDSVFKPADVRLRRNRIIIYSDEAKYVRYGWKPFSEGNLIGESELPVSTFRVKIDK